MEVFRITVEYRSQDGAKLLAVLISLAVFFAAAHISAFLWPGVSWDIVRKLLDLDNEWSLPTWYATIQLFTIGGVLLLTAWAHEDNDHLPPAVLILGGLLFVFLSADEGGGIHERINLIIESRGWDSILFSGGHGGWISVYAATGLILFLIAGFYFQSPLRRMWQRFTRECLIVLGGFAAVIAGAVGFETISYLFLRSDSTADLYQLEVAIEEFLEMAGASLILYATLEIAAALCSEGSVRRPYYQ